MARRFTMAMLFFSQVVPVPVVATVALREQVAGRAFSTGTCRLDRPAEGMLAQSAVDILSDDQEKTSVIRSDSARSIVVKHQPHHVFVTDHRPLGGTKIGCVSARQRLQTVDGAQVQYAALPYRMVGGPKFLLITSRETRRWVVPKGWPMKGKKPHACAAQEALEEAGVKGKIGKRALGCFSYFKRLPNNVRVICIVDVYPLMVERHLKRWREQGQRSLGWFTAAEAATLVKEDELASLIEAFAATLDRRRAI